MRLFTLTSDLHGELAKNAHNEQFIKDIEAAVGQTFDYRETDYSDYGAVGDIIYVSGMKDYVMFYLDNERRPLVTHLTMKSVEDMLPPQQFMRVHRSFIVCLDKIKKVDRNDCIYIGEEIIHVTEAFLPAFQQYLNSKFPGK